MKISIKGPIVNAYESMVYAWCGIPHTTAQMVENALQRATSEGISTIEVEINSGGGSVFEAVEIYTALKNFKGIVIARIVGLAASAATLIMMAGKIIEMTPSGQIMIHNASNRAEGDHQVMEENTAFLQGVDQSIMAAYTQRTGKTAEELKVLMDKTTWMTAKQALANNFIDKIMFEDEQVEAVASVNEHPTLENGMLPKSVIEKVRNEILKNASIEDVVNQIEPTELVNKSTQGEEEKTMNYETLKNEHPIVFNQILNEGMAEGVKNERTRIQEIEEIAPNNKSKLVNKAKFETGQTAAEFAMDLLRNQKQIGKDYLKNADEDAEELEEVEPSSAPEEEKKDSEKEEEETVENFANIFNKMKGGIK